MTPLANLDAERAVIGAMLLTPDALERGLERLTASDFFHPSHQNVFAAIAAVDQQGKPVDAVTVAAYLSETGTPTQFAELVAFQVGTPAAVAVDAYTDTVAERSTARAITAAAQDTIASLNEGAIDAPTAVTTLAEAAYKLELGSDADRLLTMEEISNDNTDAIFEELTSKEPILGYATGFTDLDQLVGGLRPGTFTVVGARPAMGKSVFGLAVAHHQAAIENNPTLFASLEMSHRELYGRLLAYRARLNLRQRPLSSSDMAKLANADAELREIPLHIDTTASLTLSELRSKAKRIKRRNNGQLSLIVVDYIQLMGTPPGETRQTEVAALSRGLKAIASDLDCAVLALAQLSRALEIRLDKRPMLADLRESGALEQDADNVAFIYRDEIYNPETVDVGVAEILVRKVRNGPTGTIKLSWLQHLPAFANLSTRSNGQSIQNQTPPLPQITNDTFHPDDHRELISKMPNPAL